MEDLNSFKQTYGLPVTQANHWKNTEYAYAEYQKIGKDAFENKLNYRIKLKEFKQTYGLLVTEANNWTNVEYAYQDYQHMGKDAFEKELNYRIEVEKFGRRVYWILREKFNADYECVEDEFKKMKENNWTLQEYLDDLEKEEEEEEEEEDEYDDESNWIVCYKCEGFLEKEEHINYDKKSNKGNKLTLFNGDIVPLCDRCDEEEEEDKYDDESNWVVCCECEGFLEKEEHKNYDNKSIPENKVGLSMGQVAPICTRCQEEYCNECAGKCNEDCNACTDKEED